MNMNRILTLIFFLLFPSVCFGVYDWKLITKTEKGDFYIDMNSFVIKDNKRFYLRLRDYRKKDQYGENSNIIHIETDCDKLQSRFLKDIYYERNMGKGKSKVLNEVGNWITFKKGSIGMYFTDFICSLEKSSKK